MTRALPLLAWILLSLPRAAAGSDGYRGWEYLVDRLTADGLPRERVVAVFSDPRMAAFDGLSFGLDTREPHSLYRGFRRASSIAAARRCRAEHAGVFERAERTHGVPASVVAAILYVETGCGRNTGSSPVLYRLARLAMANEPANRQANLIRLTGSWADPALERRVEARARYLEDTFYPEVRATFEVADRLGMHPLALRGSPSGAIGFPQFLPSSYLRFGDDADGNGHVNLFEVADAAASCAKYLAGNGWHPGLSVKAQREVIWRYNHSSAYIDTVLMLASAIDRPALTQEVRARPAPKRVVSRTVRRAKAGPVKARPAPRARGPVRARAKAPAQVQASVQREVVTR
jgi:membrane-bound lytic murein transglycosylase B